VGSLDDIASKRPTNIIGDKEKKLQFAAPERFRRDPDQELTTSRESGMRK
jgi:hypothetical protein